MDSEAIKQFNEFSKLLIEWLNVHSHPHAKIIIDSTSAELLTGEFSFYTDYFLKD